jgi:UDP-glucose 4-epimerase
MKLASEAAISAALESHLQRAFIFRFPNVIGVPATHGVIQDFIQKLKNKPKILDVHGDGTQQKCYLHVEELIDAMRFIRSRSKDRLNYFNIAADDPGVTVKFIAETVIERVASGATAAYGAGKKGWVGDVPKFNYSIAKLARLGWNPRLSSAQAVRKAVDEIVKQALLNFEWVTGGF